MDAIARYFDHYVISARLKPAFFVILPLAVTTVAWWPEVHQLWGAVLMFLLTFGMIGFLSNLISNHGNDLQERLFSEWGGAPTTALLRHADPHIDRYTKERYHRCIEALISGLKMPTRAQENEDPLNADACYASATNFLRKYTKDKTRFPMVYTDNVAYGYARNLLVMKFHGIVIAAVCAITNLILIYSYTSTIDSVEHSIYSDKRVLFGIGATAICLLALWLFWVVVNSEYVRGRAIRYAKSLLEVCEDSLK